MEYGLRHATHSSCWCCCCVPARLGFELNEARLGVEQKVPCQSMDGNVKTVQLCMKMKILFTAVCTCTVRVLPNTEQSSASMRHGHASWTGLYTRTRTRSTHTTHTRIHHDHTCIAVVDTRIVVSVAVRPRKAGSECCYRVCA